MNARYFRTDHLLQDLGKRAISGGLVTTTGQGAKFILNLTAAVVLARLLTPEQYGLVAMVSGVTIFLGLFKDAGLSTATVQTETITQGQVSNLFWINVVLGGVLSLIARLWRQPSRGFMAMRASWASCWPCPLRFS